MIVAILQQDLGRDEGERAADAPVEGAADALGEAEVEDLQRAGAVLALHPADVGRLDVEVHDAVAVDVGEPGRGLESDVEEGVPVPAHRRPEVGRREQLHGQERVAAGQDAEVVHLDHVGMPHLREQSHLVLEADEVLALDRLQGHLEGQRAIRPLARSDAVDDRALRARQLLLDEEVAEQLLEIRDTRSALARARPRVGRSVPGRLVSLHRPDGDGSWAKNGKAGGILTGEARFGVRT